MELSLENATKGLALAGTILYGCQFFIYSAYYSGISVSPEEVGVTNSYLVPRAAGFILIFGVILGWFLATTLALREFEDGPFRLVEIASLLVSVGGNLALGIFLAQEVVPETKSGLSWLFLIGLPVLSLATNKVVMSKKRSHPIMNALAFVGASLLIVTAIIVCLAVKASEVADCAKRGVPISAIKIVGLPLLDVSAQHVVLTWLGPAIQAPAVFGAPGTLHGADGLLLGQSANSVILRLSTTGQVVRLPPSQVSVAFPPQVGFPTCLDV